MKGVRVAGRLVVCVCTLIVAAFPRHLSAASAISDDVPVPGGVAALARVLAIDPVPDRGRFMLEVTRLVYETTESRTPSVAAFLQSVRRASRTATAIADQMRRLAQGARDDVVPVPLGSDLWSDAIFRRRVPPDELVMAIVADRQAALVCHGLASVDDETLEYIASHPNLLSRLYERSSPMFAAFAGSVRIQDGRVVPPGGADAVPLWEAVTGEKVTRADRFLLSLFEPNDGRLAYLYATIAALDPSRRAFALGLWMPPATRVERFKALATSGLGEMREWHVRTLPFGRSSFDLGMAFVRLGVDDAGAPLPPSSLGLWTRVFGSADAHDDTKFDAAWIAQQIMGLDVRQRGERLDQIGFAQRVFPAYDGDRSELVFILRAVPRHRALMLTFERMGIARPATYAAVVRSAAKLSSLEGRKGYIAQSQLQGSLALVARMVLSRTFDPATAERLIERLVAVGNDPPGGIARWLRTVLYPVLPASRDVETAMIAALAGPAAGSSSLRRVTWEGQHYRLDIATAERNRLRRVRDKQHAPPIDLALQLADAGRLLASDKATLDDLQDLVTQFTALLSDLPQRSREEEADNVPSGIAVGNNPHEVLRRALDELTKAVRGKDPKRAPRIGEPVVELADDLLARNILSFVYAASLGDPDGTVLLADDVSHRHDFGFSIKDSDIRARVTWAIPRPEVAPGVPWHVNGSLLGLDVALSSLALRRVATDHVLEAPKLTSNARDTFAASVSLMDPLALTDADRDLIAGSVERGGRRVAAVRDTAALDAIADELSIDAARRRALRWTVAHEPDRLVSLLSLTELLTLGGGRPAALHSWGMAVVAANGCLCSRLAPVGAWPALAGRPQLGLAAVVVPDVNFRVAMMLKELDLPAPLAKVILSGAVQDFIDEVKPTDDGDWLSLSRAARVITRERIEDYIAAATATGPLVPETDRSPDESDRAR